MESTEEKESAIAAEENCAPAVAEEAEIAQKEQPVPKTKLGKFLEFLKFLGFSVSAGVIEIVTEVILYEWIKWDCYWACYLIALTLSVLWNFTLNRKFTFRSASNVPFCMFLVIVYYCAFTPASTFGGGALEAIGWNGTLVTAIMMVINFLTEFLWDKFVVFNDKLTEKMLSKLRRNRKNGNKE